MSIKSSYVLVMRGVRRVLARSRLLDVMEQSDKRWVLHLRTLLAIYDTDDLIHLGLPWWTYACAELVEEFLEGRKARVLEYGSGASTVWLGRRAEHVYSVEHDAHFSKWLSSRLSNSNNITFLTVEPTVAVGEPATPSGRTGYDGLDFTDYVESIHAIGGEFDLIVVDGRARLACLEVALGYLRPDGLILFDDVKRRRYRAVLERNDLEVQVVAGAKPSIPFRDATAIVRPRPR